MLRPAIPSVRERSAGPRGEAVEIGFENRRTQAGRKARARHNGGGTSADECHFACRAGITHPVGVAAGADQIAPPLELEWVHRQRDRPPALSPADFEYV